MSSKIIAASILFVIISIIMAVVLWFNYMGRYNQDSETTATAGIFFKTTLHLDEYKNISNGNSIWGDYERYTRSDRHTETITVYCNKYCKN